MRLCGFGNASLPCRGTGVPREEEVPHAGVQLNSLSGRRSQEYMQEVVVLVQPIGQPRRIKCTAKQPSQLHQVAGDQ